MKKNAWQKVLIALFCLLLAVGGLSLSLFPAPRYSESENRYLQAFPHLSRESVLDGSFMRTLDTYATERAPFRGACRSVWSVAQLLALQHESHGVILCRDGSLSARIEQDKSALARNLTALSHVQGLLGDLPFTPAIAPARMEARSEVLPRSFSAYDLSSALPDGLITFPDCNKDEDFFRTDHHWTATGAYLAYLRLADSLGYEAYGEDDFVKQTVSTTFLGSGAARAGIPFITPDSITLWRYEGDEEFHVTRDGESATFKGLYDMGALDTRDGYAVFLGSNCGILEIALGEEDTRPTLLVIRDSFASALLPFLARHFRIVAVDPRYATPTLTTLAQSADAALLLCGVQTISDGSFLVPFLRQ